MIAARALKSSIATPTLSKERSRVAPPTTSSRSSVACAAAASDYTELKLAAVRSQLAYQDPEVVDKLWQSARNPLKALVPFKPEDINDTQAARFKKELADLDRSPTFITTPPTDRCEDAQAYAWTRGDTLFVTFRGTHGFKDIIADIEVRDTEIPSTRALNAIVSKVHDSSKELFGDVRVHEGFYEQLLSVKPQIDALLDGRDDIKTVHFSGHSLGGGIAQIAAAMFADSYSSKRVTCQTFGGPRCGNKDFVKWFEKVVADHVRVTNKNDPVPMVPQRPVWLHTSPCICIDDEVIAKAENADTPWFLRWLTTAQNIDLKGLTDDHSIELYITRLELLEELPVVSKAASSDATPMDMSGSTPQTA